MTDYPESYEVLAHYVKRFVDSAQAAPKSEELTRRYLDMIEELCSNSLRLMGVLSVISVDIYRMLLKKIGKESTIQLDFDHEPEVFESLLADWLQAVSANDYDETLALTGLLVGEDHDTIEAFLLFLMNFYLQFLADMT